MGLSLSPARERDLGIWKLINAKEENYYANKILLSYGSMIEHQSITHVDNTYWKRGSERRMSSPPKGKNAGKSMSKNELLRKGTMQTARKTKGRRHSRVHWCGNRGVQAVLERLPDPQQSCGQQRRLWRRPSNPICAAPRRSSFLRHLSVLHTQHFLAWSSQYLTLVVLNSTKDSRKAA